jgi:EAL domain-containing protein (putative c-di-GMP-specific phosphodiesterase class I)
MGNKDFLDFVLRKIREARIPAGKICFEITETAAITNLATARNFITALKEHGAWFSLDDFGVGFSSFGYLRELPVDFLKIDGTFIRDLVHNPIHLAMVKSINEIGHVLGKKTIAEFVENQETVELLRTLGVDYVQGYHIAVPRPVTDISSDQFPAQPLPGSIGINRY